MNPKSPLILSTDPAQTYYWMMDACDNSEWLAALSCYAECNDIHEIAVTIKEHLWPHDRNDQLLTSKQSI
jgi:hypothetical protein